MDSKGTGIRVRIIEVSVLENKKVGIMWISVSQGPSELSVRRSSTVFYVFSLLGELRFSFSEYACVTY